MCICVDINLDIVSVISLKLMFSSSILQDKSPRGKYSFDVLLKCFIRVTNRYALPAMEKKYFAQQFTVEITDNSPSIFPVGSSDF